MTFSCGHQEFEDDYVGHTQISLRNTYLLYVV